MTDKNAAPPSLPADTMTASWAGGMRFVHRSASGHALVTDTPPSSGGFGTAASPMEIVLLGLIGCTGVDVVSILQGMRQPVTGCEISAAYERAEEHPRVYTRIHLTYVLRGDLDAARVERAIKLSETKYCSVSAMLSSTATITHEYRIEA